ncbi:UvrD-helicase domain-containing protein [Streptomyces sp. NPDC058686]|uniref:UvrD-helicase domain-containing protein n=1 Tax=Streptomyces sp. NPDC058686 TaxID=3346599 RepID=UPI00365464F2
MTTGPYLDPAYDPADALLVIAPPGCGKTELLARRAVHVLGTLQPHQEILALTFSNRATRNLRERLQAALGPQRFRRQVTVTNFHGHAAGIIRAHGHSIGVDPNSSLPQRATLATAVAAFTDGLRIGPAMQRKAEIEAALSAAKRDALDDDQVREVLVRAGNGFALQIEDDRRAQGVLHYDDLLRHAQRLMRIDAVARLYQQHYGAVLVDEFQDLSLQQLEIALASCTANRTFVGDPLQGIYAWAGAQPAQVEQDLRKLCGTPRQLAVSYRSSPAVLGVVNRVATALNGEPLHAADPAAWLQGGAAAAADFDTGQQEAAWIVATASKIMSQNRSATIGVIARAAWRRRPIDAAFAEATQLPQQRWDLAIEDSEAVQRIIAAVRRLPRKAEMPAVRQAVVQDIDPSNAESLEQTMAALEEFESLVVRAGTPSAAAAQLREPDGDGAIEPGIHLLNAHTGKGQQFDWVFIPGLEEFHIPDNHAESETQLEEELRVLLVMLSRARHGVIVTRARSLISKAGNPYGTTPSRWWEPTSAACSLDAEGVQDHLARAGSA